MDARTEWWTVHGSFSGVSEFYSEDEALAHFTKVRQSTARFDDCSVIYHKVVRQKSIVEIPEPPEEEFPHHYNVFEQEQ